MDYLLHHQRIRHEYLQMIHVDVTHYFDEARDHVSVFRNLEKLFCMACEVISPSAELLYHFRSVPGDAQLQYPLP